MTKKIVKKSAKKAAKKATKKIVKKAVKKTTKKATAGKQEIPLTPIWEAAVANDWNTVKELLQRDPSLIDVTGEYYRYEMSLLHLAIKLNPDIELVKYLVSLGADINAEFTFINYKDKTYKIARCTPPPLHWAAWHNSNVDVLRFLVSKGVDVNAVENEKGKFRGGDQNTPLHYAARWNPNVKVLEYLISAGAKINAKGSWDYTPLHYAAQDNSNIEVLEYLISAGADVHAKDDMGSGTPLDVARTEEAKHILREAMGQVYEKKNMTKKTEQQTANAEQVDIDANQSSNNRPTLTGVVLPPLDEWDMSVLLDWAIQSKPLEFIKYLVEQGVNAKVIDECVLSDSLHCATCLGRAGWEDCLDVVQCLISAGADVNAKNCVGETPLHQSAIRNYKSIDVLQYLIEQGADPHVKDDDGKTPLDVANGEETKRILREAMGLE